MVSTSFFVLLCLVPLAVMGDKKSWLPEKIPWPAQQCLDAGMGFVGECVIALETSRYSPFYLRTAPCRSLKCALPRNRDGYSMVRRGRPLDGTLCGFLKACREGLCVDIEPTEIPLQTGISTTYDCRPVGMPLIPINSNALPKHPSRKV